MRKVIFSIIIVIIAIALFLFTYDFRAEQEQSFYKYSISSKEYKLLKDGDIILRYGYGLVSDYIVKTLKEDYYISHCGIIVIKDGKYKVIHSVSQSLSDYDGVQEQSLEKFINHSQVKSIIVTRFKTTDKKRKLISKKAIEYKDRQIPFDHSFNINDSSEIYCSELIWKIILDQFKIDIFPDKSEKTKNYLNFSNFYNPDYFEIIINHQEK